MAANVQHTSALTVPSGAPTTAPTVGAYLADEITGKVVLQALSEQGWATDNVCIGGIDAAIDDIAQRNSEFGCPDVLIVDLTGSPDPRTDIQALAEVCDPGTLVTALGTWNDVSLYRDFLQAGVQDYLMKPVTADALRQSLAVAEGLLSEPEFTPAPVPAAAAEPATQQQVIVTGVRGGLGASSLATNLASYFAGQGRQTALMDMDLVFGTTAMQFDLEPGRGLVDALENPSRVDGLFLERAVVKPTTNLAILASEVPPNSMGMVAPGADGQLVGALKENFSHLVIDLPRHQIDRFPQIFEQSSDLIILADLSVVSARDTIRLIAHAKSVAPHLSVHLVGAMMGLGGHEVDAKDFENSVEHPFTATMPFEPKVFVQAAQAAKSVIDVAPQSKITGIIRKLAAAVDAEEERAEKPGWLARLLGQS